MKKSKILISSLFAAAASICLITSVGRSSIKSVRGDSKSGELDIATSFVTGEGEIEISNTYGQSAIFDYDAVTKSGDKMIFEEDGIFESFTPINGLESITLSFTGANLYLGYARVAGVETVTVPATNGKFDLPYQCGYFYLCNNGADDVEISTFKINFSCAMSEYTGDINKKAGTQAPTYEDGTYETTVGGTINEFTFATLTEGTFQASMYKAVPNSDAGLIFCVGDSTGDYWDNGCEYYAFMLNMEGKAMLGKCGNGWNTIVFKDTPFTSSTKSVDIAVSIKDHVFKLIIEDVCYVQFYDYSECNNVKIGFRAAEAGTKFSDITVDPFFSDAEPLNVVHEKCGGFVETENLVTSTGASLGTDDSIKMEVGKTYYSDIKYTSGTASDSGLIFGFKSNNPGFVWEAGCGATYYFFFLNNENRNPFFAKIDDEHGYVHKLGGHVDKGAETTTKTTHKFGITVVSANSVYMTIDGADVFSGAVTLDYDITGSGIGYRTNQAGWTFTPFAVETFDNNPMFSIKSGSFWADSTINVLKPEADGTLAWCDNKTFSPGQTLEVDVYITGYTDTANIRVGLAFGADKTTVWNEKNFYLYFADAGNAVCGTQNNWQTSNIKGKADVGYAQDKLMTYKVEFTAQNDCKCWMNGVELTHERAYDADHTCGGNAFGLLYQSWDANNATARVTFSNIRVYNTVA